jgi:molybdopterin biosynthesis enzyme MoaB
MGVTVRVGILTVSDRGSRGEREDTSGPAIAQVLRPLNPEIVEKAIVPDDADLIAAQLRAWLNDSTMNLIITTGGTGLGPRSGATGSTLILNLPGSEKGVRQNLGAVMPVLGHALQILAGDTEH